MEAYKEFKAKFDEECPGAYRGGIAFSGEPSRVNQVFPAFMLTHFIYSGGVK